MLRHLCVAYADDERAEWALELGALLARQAEASLTLVHVAPLIDEATDPTEELNAELLGLREDIYWHQRLTGLALELGGDVEVDVRVPLGRVGDQLLALLDVERPDVLIMGASRPAGFAGLVGPRRQHRILAGAPCPVLLACAPPPSSGDPTLLVAQGERLHGFRDRLGLSPLAALIERAPYPVLVINGRSIVDGGTGAANTPMATPQTFESSMGDAAEAAGAQPRGRRRNSLLWQLFAANAVILAVAMLVLLLAPVSVSQEVVLTEALTLSVGLAAMLVVNLHLLRRTLEPLRQLSVTMAAVDLRRPGRRLARQTTRDADVQALADSFNAMLDRLESERRNSARLALAAQEDERKRIAHEIHDQVGQLLTALTLQAQRAAAGRAPADPEALEQLADTALEALDEVRRIGRELHPEALDDLGLGNALIALCRRLSSQSGVRIDPRIERVPALRSEVDLVVYRVAQEAITNALRHASASRVTVRLRAVDSAVELTVGDDGRGFPGQLPDGTAGITGMRERASLVAGTLDLDSAPERGAEVRLRIPLGEAMA